VPVSFAVGKQSGPEASMEEVIERRYHER